MSKKRMEFMIIIIIIAISTSYNFIEVKKAFAESKTKINYDKYIEILSLKEELMLYKERYYKRKFGSIAITISFAGDCTLGTDESFGYKNSFPDRFKKEGNDYGYFMRNVKSLFQDDDLTLVNLETTLTDETKKAEKKFRFKGDPSYATILSEASIEMVNISNNHIYDYHEEGFIDTLKALDSQGILYSGEDHIAYYKIKGITIGSVGYTGWGTWIKDYMKADIKEVREKADIILVSFHWGDERIYYPNYVQKKLGRLAIDLGADVVVGHHPHVIQGIEEYKDRYIVYSLGNFSFGGNKNPKDKDTIIFQNIFTIRNKKITKSHGRIIPCSISSVSHVNDYQPTILWGEEYERILDRIYEYSSKLEYGIYKKPETLLK